MQNISEGIQGHAIEYFDIFKAFNYKQLNKYIMSSVDAEGCF